MLKLGELLQSERIEKGLSLKEVSKATKIKTDFLEAIEKGEYSKLPSVSYVQGFVKNYTKYLGLSENEIMPLFRREFDVDKNFRVLPKGLEREQEFSVSRFKFKQTFIVIGILLFLLLSYIAFQYRYAFLPPFLTIDSPKDNSTVTSSNVVVRGKTDSNATVYVNEDAVSVDSSGNFKKTINVFPGRAVINVKAINRFSKQTDKKIEINVKPSS